MPARLPRNCCMRPGAKVIAVSDSTGCIYNRNGLDIPELMHMKALTGHVEGFPESEPITPGELLALEVRHPGSRGARKRRSPPRMRPRCARSIVAEAANGPLTPAADRILESKGVVHHPRHSVQCRRRDGLLLRMGAG